MADLPPIQAVIIPVTAFQQNCSLVWCTRTRQAAVIDPGGEVERILAVVEKHGLTLAHIWLTHGHLDHAGGAAALKRQLGLEIIGPHEEDQFLVSTITEQGRAYGLPGAESCAPDRWLKEGDVLTCGELSFDVVHCPGHTPGHVVIVSREHRIAFVGDVIFKGSIGRTDFPRGNHQDLLDAITTKLWPMGDDMRFVPGHGEMSTFGWERKTNPFVSDLALGRA